MRYSAYGFILVTDMAHQVKKHVGVTYHKNHTEFRVWAPNASSVAIEGTFTPEGAMELANENDGYWNIIINGVEPGQNYRYIITNGDKTLYKNDPRGLALTASDNGFSVVVDDEFDWQNDDFTPPPYNQQIIYELHIGTFNRPDPATPGTFDSAIERLDYLKELGVNMIELMPVTSMAFSNGWGYAPNYLYSVESMLGGRHGLMKFVRECHARGIGVILDVVYNHFYGSSDLWQFDGWSENGRGGIYFYNDQRGDTPWGGRPDYGRPEVRQFILDNVVMWLTDYRLDGLRLDSTIYMRNTAGFCNDPEHDIPDAWYLMQDITTAAHKINPAAITIAEDFSCTEFMTKPVKDSGAGFNAQWEISFPHAIRQALGIEYGTDQNLAGLAEQLERQYNNDPFQKIIFSDSHDTAANGSVRLNEAAAPKNANNKRARAVTLVANALTLTAAGIPMLLQGSEFLQDGAFNDWQALAWDKLENHQGIIAAHRHLIDLRINRYGHTAGLLGAHTAIIHQDGINQVIAYHRWDQGGPRDDVIVIANCSPKSFANYSLQLPRPGTWTVRFNSSWQGYSPDFKEVELTEIITGPDNSINIPLPPYGVYVLSQG